jgi:hypothetical protein
MYAYNPCHLKTWIPYRKSLSEAQVKEDFSMNLHYLDVSMVK